METTQKTQTRIGVEGAKVIIQHSNPVGTQYLTPEQARIMAQALIQSAAVVEAGGN